VQGFEPWPNGLEPFMLPLHHTRVYFEVSIGIEPIYRDFADLDLTSRTTDLVVVPRTGIEPVTLRL